MEFEQSLGNVEEEENLYQLSKAESFHSVSSEPSRIGEEEGLCMKITARLERTDRDRTDVCSSAGSLSDSETNSLRSASTSDVQSLRRQ